MGVNEQWDQFLSIVVLFAEMGDKTGGFTIHCEDICWWCFMVINNDYSIHDSYPRYLLDLRRDKLIVSYEQN